MTKKIKKPTYEDLNKSGIIGALKTQMNVIDDEIWDLARRREHIRKQIVSISHMEEDE